MNVLCEAMYSPVASRNGDVPLMARLTAPTLVSSCGWPARVEPSRAAPRIGS